MGKRRLVSGILMVGLLAMALAGCAGSTAEFPGKPVELTILFGAGGSADLVGRQLAKGMEQRLGQSVPVVNRTGGGGAIGYTHVKGQKPDGYNIVWSSSSISTAHYQGNMKLTYKDFVPVAQVSYEAGTIAVRADSPFKTLQDLIDHAKQNPGKVKVGNSGAGSFTHFAAATFANKAGLEVVHVPFGQGLAISSLLGGQIDASVQLPGEIISQVEAGQARILAVTSEQRDPALPDVPTLKESGVDLTTVLWRGIHAPAGTPEETITKLEAAIKETVESDEFKQAVAKFGAIPAFLGASEFGEMVAQEDAMIKELMTELGLGNK